MGDCEHSVGANPRNATTCVKCGRSLSGRWLRDPERRRELLLRVASAPGQAAAESLAAYAEARTQSGPVRRLKTRNFRREILEELGDAANYFAWLDDQRALRDAGGLSHEETIALHHLVQAWRWMHSQGEDW